MISPSINGVEAYWSYLLIAKESRAHREKLQLQDLLYELFFLTDESKLQVLCSAH